MVAVLSAKSTNYEYVDLGLSVKWATMNVGATQITDFGCYYAWAETSPKDEYDWTTYKYTEEKATKMTKYNLTGMGAVVDFKTELEAIDDAATANWGDDWRTPSLDEMNELIQNCDWIWFENYNQSGVNGFVVQSNIPGFTDNFIFLPAAGHWGGKHEYDTNSGGMYWTSTLDKYSYANIKACQLYFGAEDAVTMSYDRQIGMTIRPVYGARKETVKDYDVSGIVQGHYFVDLGLSVQWATCNIGTEEPKLGGNLFSWAETDTKSSFTIENYKYSNNGSYSSMSKYNKSDGLTVLQPIDDAATVNWGDEWRTPTESEFEELINGCDWYVNANCFYGVSKINNNVIIISIMTGYRDDSYYNYQTTGGYYWSANRGNDVQRAFAFIYSVNGSYFYITSNVNRYFGYAVRPVLCSKHETAGIEQVEETENQGIKDGVYLIDNRVLIRKNGKLYNLNGTIAN